MIAALAARLWSKVVASVNGLPRSVRYLAGDLVAGLGALAVVVFALAVAALSVIGIGVLLAGAATSLVRAWCDRDRRRTGRFLGRRISSPYAHPPSMRPSAVRDHLRGGTLGRDLGAVLVRCVVGVPLGLLAVLLPLVSLNSALVPLYWWWAQPRDEAGALFHVTSWWGALASTLVGLAGLAVWLATPPVALADASLAARLLSPSRDQELRQRVEIEESRRRSAVSAHTAELRRIERDLHDAAQNRLVAVAMFVGMAQRQLATGGEAPTEALASAHSAATDALAEVRRIIQGIYPPVLTEEGLIPALGLLVDRSQIPTRLHVDRPAPTPAAVDAALYFSIAEALTNVAKHSGATECAVELSWDQTDDVPWVTAVVTDDGRGGADTEQGSGLAGIEDRAQALGGRISVLSPPGGPTTIRMSLPCES